MFCFIVLFFDFPILSIDIVESISNLQKTLLVKAYHFKFKWFAAKILLGKSLNRIGFETNYSYFLKHISAETNIVVDTYSNFYV